MKIQIILLLLFINSSLFASVIEPVDTISPENVGYKYEPVDDEFMKEIEDLMMKEEKQEKVGQAIDSFQKNMLDQEMKFDWMSTLPILKGLFLTKTSNKFTHRDVIFPFKSSDFSEYIPSITPLAITWALKGLGIESRSKAKRLATANAIGLGIDVSLVLSMKKMFDRQRPDGKDNDSYPSGHSALAFFSATILDREYGHYSPWVSVAGYSLAMGTQIRRIHLNRHYLNDVILGAGIGTVSANLGYFITDKIFGKNQINSPLVNLSDANRYIKFLNKPSSITLVSGVETGYNRIKEDNYEILDQNTKCSLRSSAAFSASLEYSHFIDKNWAVEAITRISQHKVQTLPDDPTVINGIYGNNFYQYHFNVGAKYSTMFGISNRVGLRTYIGGRVSPEVEFKGIESNQTMVRLNKSNDFEVGAGVFFDFLSNSKYLTGFAVDFTHPFSSLFTDRFIISSYWKIII